MICEQREQAMGRNIKLVIQYDGTRYAGWQRIPGNAKTIQYKLEYVISRMLGAPVELIGAGRTDKGVHALCQVANFHEPAEATVYTCQEMLEYINAHLPKDIAVVSVSEESERFHARFHCKSKTYCYRIDNRQVQDVFQSKFRTHIQSRLDVRAMQRAAASLEGEHDFTSFTSAKSKNKSMVRRLTSVTVTSGEEAGGEGFINLTFTGNGFLYHMVRIMAGTLIEVGLHQREAKDIKSLFAAKERAVAGYTAPPEGLVLEELEY